LEVIVEDTGTGVPDDIKSRIFDPFFTTKEVGKGTGHGLSLVHEVVVGQCGGMVSITDAESGGACFTLLFPVDGPQS
jgi:signal transduction histidine kinase